jgi:prepilin-type processing-associated H-X9-DG protein
MGAVESHARDQGKYPWAAQEGQPVPQDWVHWQPARRLEESAIAAYLPLPGRATLTCPGDADNRYRVYPFSYTMNAHIEKLAPSLIVNKRRMVLLYEEKHPNDGACAPGEAADALTRRHRGRSHAAFGDGGVESVSEGYATEWARCRPVVINPK